MTVGQNNGRAAPRSFTPHQERSELGATFIGSQMKHQQEEVRTGQMRVRFGERGAGFELYLSEGVGNSLDELNQATIPRDKHGAKGHHGLSPRASGTAWPPFRRERPPLGRAGCLPGHCIIASAARRQQSELSPWKGTSIPWQRTLHSPLFLVWGRRRAQPSPRIVLAARVTSA